MGKVGGLIRRTLYRSLPLDGYLKVLNGAYLFCYRAGLMRRSPAFEYPRFFRNLVSADDTVIDIGANLGYYSYVFSRPVGPSGRVCAVEPVRPILDVLRHNLRRCGNVDLFGSMGYAGYTLAEGKMKPLSADDRKDIAFIHASKTERYRKYIRA